MANFSQILAISSLLNFTLSRLFDSYYDQSSENYLIRCIDSIIDVGRVMSLMVQILQRSFDFGRDLIT